MFVTIYNRIVTYDFRAAMAGKPTWLADDGGVANSRPGSWAGGVCAGSHGSPLRFERLVVLKIGSTSAGGETAAIRLAIQKSGGHEYVSIREWYWDATAKIHTNRTVENIGRLDLLLKEDPGILAKLEAHGQRLRQQYGREKAQCTTGRAARLRGVIGCRPS